MDATSIDLPPASYDVVENDITSTSAEPRYAGLTPRLLAALIDCSLFLPVYVATSRAETHSRAAVTAWMFAGWGLWIAYNLAFYLGSGQTLGKRITGLRLVTLDGTALSARTVFDRMLPFLALSVPISLGQWVALGRVPQSFPRLAWEWRVEEVALLTPAWADFADSFLMLFIAACVATVALTRHRQSLHDMYARTAVIDIRPPAAVRDAGLTRRHRAFRAADWTLAAVLWFLTVILLAGSVGTAANEYPPPQLGYGMATGTGVLAALMTLAAMSIRGARWQRIVAHLLAYGALSIPILFGLAIAALSMLLSGG